MARTVPHRLLIPIAVVGLAALAACSSSSTKGSATTTTAAGASASVGVTTSAGAATTTTAGGGTISAGGSVTTVVATTNFPTSFPTIPISTPSTAARVTTTAAPTTAAPIPPPTTAVPPATTAASLRCHTSELSAELGASDNGAGQVYAPLVIHNIGTRTCNVAGYPGVSLLDASGTQIGAPATRELVPTATISLAPGAAAAALLHTTNGPIGGPCLAPSVKMKVFPPNELDALVFPAVYTACGGFTVRPFVAGTTGT